MDVGAMFRIKPGERMSLSERDPADTGALPDKSKAKAQTAQDAAVINELQDRLYAEGQRALLVILQGTDTSGKDGTIRHVFNATGPLGVSVTAFRAPSEEERRTISSGACISLARAAGTIGIFNRSHYEDVLIGRVRKLFAPAEVIEPATTRSMRSRRCWPRTVRPS